jgi:hypothetical protein
LFLVVDSFDPELLKIVGTVPTNALVIPTMRSKYLYLLERDLVSVYSRDMRHVSLRIASSTYLNNDEQQQFLVTKHWIVIARDTRFKDNQVEVSLVRRSEARGVNEIARVGNIRTLTCETMQIQCGKIQQMILKSESQSNVCSMYRSLASLTHTHTYTHIERERERERER